MWMYPLMIDRRWASDNLSLSIVYICEAHKRYKIRESAVTPNFLKSLLSLNVGLFPTAPLKNNMVFIRKQSCIHTILGYSNDLSQCQYYFSFAIHTNNPTHAIIILYYTILYNPCECGVQNKNRSSIVWENQYHKKYKQWRLEKTIFFHWGKFALNFHKTNFSFILCFNISMACQT